MRSYLLVTSIAAALVASQSCTRTDRLGTALRDPETVTVLNISYSGLAALPREINKLRRLKTLNVSNNHLITLPIEIGSLSDLTDLDVSLNALTLVPSSIGKLSTLVHLRLDGNRLTTLPSEIGMLSRLEDLQLDSNPLSTLPEELGRLQELRVLVASRMALRRVPRSLTALIKLKWLDLAANGLDELPANIGNLKQLERLECGWTYGYHDTLIVNNIETLPASIGDLQELTWLNLSRNQLSSLPNEVWRIPKLEHLDLSYNRLSQVSPQIRKLAHLKTLDLRNNRLTSVPRELAQLSALEELDLRGNHLTSLPPEVARLRLRMLRIDGNSLPTKTLVPQWMKSALRVLALLVGVFVLYAAAFLYENEEKQLQNKLEDLWIRLDDYQHFALSRQAAFLKTVAAASIARMDEAFGHAVSPIQPSRLLSVGKYTIIISMTTIIALGPISQACENDRPCLAPLSIGIMTLLLGSILALVFLRHRLVTWLAIICVMLVTIASLGEVVIGLTLSGVSDDPFFSTMLRVMGIAPAIALPLAVCCNSLAIGVFRNLLYRVLNSEKFIHGVVIMSGLFLAAFVFSGLVPMLWFWIIGMMEAQTASPALILFVTMEVGLSVIIFTTTVASVFLLLVIVMLLHRVIWPVVTRPVHAASRFGLFAHRKTLAIAGVALIGVQIPSASGILEKLIKAFS